MLKRSPNTKPSPRSSTPELKFSVNLPLASSTLTDRYSYLTPAFGIRRSMPTESGRPSDKPAAAEPECHLDVAHIIVGAGAERAARDRTKLQLSDRKLIPEFEKAEGRLLIETFVRYLTTAQVCEQTIVSAGTNADREGSGRIRKLGSDIEMNRTTLERRQTETHLRGCSASVQRECEQYQGHELQCSHAFSMIRRILLLGISVVLVACGGDDDDGTGPDELPAIDTVFTPTPNDFSPFTLTIRRGGTAVFSFGAEPHNAIFERKTGAPQDIQSTMNQNVSRVFPVVGTFPYDCTLHPGMAGEIIVR